MTDAHISYLLTKLTLHVDNRVVMCSTKLTKYIMPILALNMEEVITTRLYSVVSKTHYNHFVVTIWLKLGSRESWLSNVIFHARLSSINGHLSSKIVFNQRLSFIKGRLVIH